MQVRYSIIIMDVQDLQAPIQCCHKGLKINSHQICMSCVKAKPQHLSMTALIYAVNPLSRLFCITAGALHDMPQMVIPISLAIGTIQWMNASVRPHSSSDPRK